jgi:prevent-host-death family protein
MSMATKRTVPAGQFKQGCLAMLDEVARNDIEIVVTKRGRPVARLVPIADARQADAAILARLRGAAGSVGRDADLLAPTSTFTKWKSLSKARRR